MRTAISVPDDVFGSADDLAQEMGVSRSELYSTAVAEYVAKHRSADITARLNEVYAEVDGRLPPVVGILVSSNLRLLDAPGNVLIRARDSGLPRGSVANVAQFVTVDLDYLAARVGKISRRTLQKVEAGVRVLLDL